MTAPLNVKTIQYNNNKGRKQLLTPKNLMTMENCTIGGSSFPNFPDFYLVFPNYADGWLNPKFSVTMYQQSIYFSSCNML